MWAYFCASLATCLLLTGCGYGGLSHSDPSISWAYVVLADSYATFDAALAACPATSCTIQFPAGSWTTIFYAGNQCISRSNLTLVGAGAPQMDSDSMPTKLEGGTIIEPGLSFCGASNIIISDMGFDDGPAYFSATGIATDGLIFQGATGAVGEPMVTNVAVSNEIALGSGSNAQFHANLFEHVDGVKINNIAAALDTHCNVIKSRDVIVVGLTGAGCGNDAGLIIKGDGYTTVTNVIARNISAKALTPGDSGSGVILDAEGVDAVSDIAVYDVQTTGVQFAVNLLNNSGAGVGGLMNVSIRNVSASLSDMPAGRIPSCLLSQTNSAGHAMENIEVSNFNCINITTEAAAPVEIYNDWLQSTIQNWSSSNGGYCSTLGGTIEVTGWIDDGAASSVPTFCTQDSTTVVHVTGYSSDRGNSPFGALAPGSVLTVQP
jgi:hypothetical protein